MRNALRGAGVVFGISAALLAVVACSDDEVVPLPTPTTTPTKDASIPVDSGERIDAQADAGTAADTGTPDSSLGDTSTTAARRVVYVESNAIAANGNSVLAFVQGDDGSLTPLAGSPFLTGGTGVGNPTQALGPDDGDQQIVLSPDKKHLFAVNAGSNTIAVFDVHDDGALVPIAGSPFPSGGINPISVGLAGDQIFVVNQAQDPAQPGVGTPGYVGIPLAANGALGTPGALVPAGKSPQLALATPDAKLLFGLDFMAPLANSKGPLRAFAIGANGALTPAAGTPMAIPVVPGGMPEGTPLALGLALHPAQKILYVGFVVRKQIGVYTYDATGALTYVANTAVSGAAPCWIRMNQAGSRAYVTDTATNSVSVLDTSAPLAPTEIQHLVLADKGPDYDAGAMSSPTSETYEESLSPDGKYLFVLSQNTNPDLSITAGNVLHVLTVATDGKLTETVPDVKLNLPTGVRPQGVAVLR